MKRNRTWFLPSSCLLSVRRVRHKILAVINCKAKVTE